MSEVVNEVSSGRRAAYTVKEFCSMYSIGRTLCYDEITAGRLKTKKVGGRTLVLAGDADAWASSLPDGRAA